MLNKRLFKYTFALLFIVAVLNLVGVYLYLNWSIWWFDMLLHFLAGITMGMATILFLQYFFNTKIFSFSKLLLISITVGLVIGLLWEIYELYFGITSFSDGVIYVTDTISDLVLDVVGAFLGYLYAQRLKI
jgi:magnesium-transporting ATPase (P-type)